MDQLAALLLFFVLESGAEIRMSLNSEPEDKHWVVWNENQSIHVPASVPGGIYTDLQSAGIIPKNLFYRFNDMELRWVSKENWTYKRRFDVSRSLFEKNAINLVFHGIDTLGEIFLNGENIAYAESMFIRHIIPIKRFLKEKDNDLEIRLPSPVQEADRLSKQQNKTYPIPPQCPPPQYNGECHVNFLRKMQASFSWDWGPAFPSVGIWKSVEIEAFDIALIRDVTTTVSKTDTGTWTVNISTYVECSQESSDFEFSEVSARLFRNNYPAGEAETNVKGGDHSRYVRNGFVFNLQLTPFENDVDLWWPNGFGQQPLYDLILTLKSSEGVEISSKSIRIGFRTIELVEEPIRPDSPGLSFYFKVNGVPIFAKGSNWIPGHILPELGYDESMLRHSLTSARDVNMNMLRVWGGGVYESDTFYTIADELGILIWQDLMFACSMYPVDWKFLQNLKTETEQQIRRLQHHPSIAVWAGNNENEVALRQNWYGTGRNFSQYKKDYIRLYVETLQPIVEDNDNSRKYLVSSPSNGVDSVREGYIATNPQSPLFGDVHHYEYILDGWNSYIYPDARFVSEYGFQSMPSYKSMTEVSLASDRNLGSEFTSRRQHHIVGNFAMLSLIQRNLPHWNIDESEESYKTFIYYSQISQAMAVKAETEKYRRDRSKLTGDNKGFTMGAMYWQLNDVWQAPSWSSIEFGGRWKMLHYYARKFFAPVLVSPEVTASNVINLFLVSDLLEDILGATLSVSVYNWEDFTPRKSHWSKVLLKKETSTLHKVYQLSDLIRDADCRPEECFVLFKLETSSARSENVVFPVKFHAVKTLVKPSFEVTVSETGDPARVAVRIETDRIAPFVWLETDEEGVFSDNGFLLYKREIELSFYGKNYKDVDVEKMRSTLTIRSLVSSNASSIKRHLSIAKTVTQGLTNLAVEGLRRVFT